MPPRALILASLAALSLGGASARATPGAGPGALPDTAAAASAGRQVRALLDGGSYAAAESLAWRLESHAEARPGSDSLEYAQALDLLVEALIRNGHIYHAEPRPFADLALAIRERHLGSDNSELVPPLLNLGDLLSRYGEDPILPLARAVALCERDPRPDSLQLAEALDALGLDTWFVRHGPEAEAMVRRAYAIRDRHLTADPERASSLGSLSIIAWDQGHGKEAVRLLEQTAGMMERTLGPEHPRLARVLRVLALRKRFMQDPAGADDLFQRAIAIEGRSLRPTHPERAASLMLAADNLSDLGEPERTGPMLEEALAIRERELPPGHAEIAWNLASLGGWHASQGDLATARSMLERALTMQRRTLSSDDHFIGITERILAAVLVDFGEYEEARKLYQESEHIYAKHFAEGNPDLLWAHMSLAYAQVLTGDPERARRELLRLLPQAAQIEGKDGRLTSQYLRILGVADETEGRWGEARLQAHGSGPEGKSGGAQGL